MLGYFHIKPNFGLGWVVFELGFGQYIAIKRSLVIWADCNIHSIFCGKNSFQIPAHNIIYKPDFHGSQNLRGDVHVQWVRDQGHRPAHGGRRCYDI